MEQRFYKVRLTNGRVIGPLDLERIKLFVAKDKITGLEMVRLYPTGDWKDINTYPEIADVLMLKLEGKLTLDPSAVGHKGESDGNTMATLEDPAAAFPNDLPPEPPPGSSTIDYPATPQLQMDEASKSSPTMRERNTPMPTQAVDDERTMMVTPDDERTVMVSSPRADEKAGGVDIVAIDASDLALPEHERPEEPKAVDTFVANEKTAMLTRPGETRAAAAGGPGYSASGEKGWRAHKKKIVASVVIVLVAAFMTNDPEKTVPPGTPPESFKLPTVELPATRTKPDPAKSEAIFKKAMPVYYEDTVEGYVKAAELLKDAASWDHNNVRALCLLASTYMNLFDVIDRNASYFNVVTRLIEMERAQNIDLAETVIADVELYLMLGNADAAFTRIVEFAKTHDWGVDMVYYLALTFYHQGKYADALQQLNKIERKDFFSPKISYLYGLIFERNGQIDDAVKAYQLTIDKSHNHVKAHVHLAGLFFQKDNLPEAGKHADFVIGKKWLASQSEQAKAYYYRARMHLVANRDAEALKDLEKARTLSPDDQDILLDYYTLRAKEGGTVKDAPGLAKMFYFMAQGEKAMKEERIDDALAQYLSAREANDKDSTPLVRLSDVFLKKGDPQAAIVNLKKAVDLAPKRKDILYKYIHVLIMGYELVEATNQLKALSGNQTADSNTLDRLYGELFLKEDKAQEAAMYLKRALQSNNYDSTVYVDFGNLMFKASQFQDAAFYMGLAQRFDPFNVDATVIIGKSLSEIDNLDKGVEYVQQQLQLSPNKAALLNGIGEIYLGKGKNEEAIKFADNALMTDSKCAVAHRTRGMAYTAMNKRKEALDALETYTNLAPLDPQGHIERSRVFQMPDEKGRIDMAMAKGELIKVQQIFPRYPGINFMIGDMLRRTGDLDHALFQAGKEIEANPGFIPAYILASTILNKSKKYKDALEKCEAVLRLNPNYAPALLQCGIANHGMKSYNAAVAMLERSSQLDQGNPDVWMALGKVYYDLNKYGQMKAAFKKYLEDYPDAPDKTEVEEYLKKVGG